MIFLTQSILGLVETLCKSHFFKIFIVSLSEKLVYVIYKSITYDSICDFIENGDKG